MRYLTTIAATLAFAGVALADPTPAAKPEPAPAPAPPCITADAVKRDVTAMEQEYLRTVNQRLLNEKQAKALADREGELRGALQALGKLKPE
ncbi:MAG: hypothetical protein AB7I42_22930 [Bradyrhizobium sp.]|uniref:hypothetical protein n=1 Tax=Bradyrhizobium sp. TaxID=376 RepID=UPI003D0E8F25